NRTVEAIWLDTCLSHAQRIKALEAEVRELKRANEILYAASSFFAQELDGRGSSVHRRSSRPVRGQADLPGAHRACRQDRSVRLLRVQDPPRVRARPGRRGADRAY